jgi:hypothetical protein
MNHREILLSKRLMIQDDEVSSRADPVVDHVVVSNKPYILIQVSLISLLLVVSRKPYIERLFSQICAEGSIFVEKKTDSMKFSQVAILFGSLQHVSLAHGVSSTDFTYCALSWVPNLTSIV